MTDPVVWVRAYIPAVNSECLCVGNSTEGSALKREVGCCWSLKIKIGDARETQLRRRREILSQKICWKTVLLQSAKSMLWLVKSGMKSQKTWKFRLIFATIFLLIRASFSCLLCFQSSPSRAQSLYSSQRALTPLTAPLQSRWSQRAF